MSETRTLHDTNAAIRAKGGFIVISTERTTILLEPGTALDLSREILRLIPKAQEQDQQDIRRILETDEETAYHSPSFRTDSGVNGRHA